jgi:ATP-dependent RNA helicase RhlE
MPGLEGRDVLACAQTGTGKTAAFALPILQRLSAHPASGKAARCLVLCPTRELATQIGQGFRTYGRNLSLHHTVIFGGVNQNPQVKHLRHGIDIIVATPGRLLDLLNQGHVDLRGIEVLVLDEADRMLDMGFIHDIRRIVAKISAKRQTMMFSATMPPEIRQLAGTLLRSPAVIQVAPVATTADGIDQSVYFVEKGNKPQLLAHLVNELPMSRAIVFTRTKHGADKVVKHLHHRGIKAEAIHGNKSQNARERALANFRSSKIPVLVATDIASRGIDIDGVSHVVNYDLTHEPEAYVHRIGRTARAGATGAAVSFCSADEKSNLRAIEKLIRQSIPVRTDHPNYESRPAHAASHAGSQAAPAGQENRSARAVAQPLRTRDLAQQQRQQHQNQQQQQRPQHPQRHPQQANKPTRSGVSSGQGKGGNHRAHHPLHAPTSRGNVNSHRGRPRPAGRRRGF